MYEVGKVYKINHSRKGKFSIKVTKVSEEWVDGDIVEGVAGAIMSYNVRETGESICSRKSLISSHEEVQHED